eukprot:maker-scaffold390_size186308-snap-gene-0.35 protein:Tk06352 transcript:maker-scaffold390_size186308-snap-gene-0.35-mRNA-1 annotation:"GOT1Sr"
MSCFDHLPLVPTPHHFNLIKQAGRDDHPRKVNLLIGAYRDEVGEPVVLPVVKRVEHLLAQRIRDGTDHHDYCPPEGLPGFSRLAAQLALGQDSRALLEGRLVMIQPGANSAGVRVGCEVLKQVLPTTHVLIGKPTWLTHGPIAEATGFIVGFYRYWDPIHKRLDLAGMLEDLEEAPTGSIVILQPAAHNPTGMDPSPKQWTAIADVIQSNKLLPFFDSCYQGFASGDPDVDAWPLRLFEARGMEMVIAQSFSKNFGLYGERVANLILIVKDKSIIPDLKATLAQANTALTGTGASYGAKIVREVLSKPDLEAEWRGSIKTMTDRIRKMREELCRRLEALSGESGSWEHITQQSGMFSYLGLSPKQSVWLVREKHVYIYHSGRANMAGLPDRDLDYVAQSIYEASQID